MMEITSQGVKHWGPSLACKSSAIIPLRTSHRNEVKETRENAKLNTSYIRCFLISLLKVITQAILLPCK